MEKEGWSVELVDNQNLGFEAPPMNKIRQKRRKKGDVREAVATIRAIEKSRYVRVIEGEAVRKDDPIKYFFPTRVPLSPRAGVMVIAIPQNEEISGGGKNRGRKGVSFLSSEEKRIGEHKR